MAALCYNRKQDTSQPQIALKTPISYLCQSAESEQSAVYTLSSPKEHRTP